MGRTHDRQIVCWRPPVALVLCLQAVNQFGLDGPAFLMERGPREGTRRPRPPRPEPCDRGAGRTPSGGFFEALGLAELRGMGVTPRRRVPRGRSDGGWPWASQPGVRPGPLPG